MALVFTLDFEENDLSDFSRTTNGEDLAANATAALVGNYGMEVTCDDTSIHYGEKDFTNSQVHVRYRFYFDISNLTMADGDAFDFDAITLDGSYSGITNFSYVVVRRSGVNYEIRANFRDDSASTNFTTWTAFTKASSHYVEFYSKRETADGNNDGIGRLYLDGVETGGSFTNLQNFNIFPTMTRYDFGIKDQDTGTTSSFYLDDAILRDDDTEIGPAGADLNISVDPSDAAYYTQGIRVK
jgi:hypothetical protein